MPKIDSWLYVRPLGLASATTWRNVADVTNFLFENKDIKLLVEIGANYCGFAALMVARTIIFPNFGYLGIEMEVHRKNANLEHYMSGQPRCKIIWRDCFEAAVIAEVGEWVRATTGRALIWCDGDNKPKEIRAYSHLLRVNDYLMMHDYSHKRISEVNPCWEDCEPLVKSGEFQVATPDYWGKKEMMFLLKKVANI